MSSVNGDILQKTLRHHGIPKKLVNITIHQYVESRCSEFMEVGWHRHLKLITGRRQGYVLSQFLFLVVIHRITTHIVQYGQNRTSTVTAHHRGPKRKLQASYTAPSWQHHAMCHHSYFYLLHIPGLCNEHHSFTVESGTARFLCGIHAFEVGHHPHSLGYPSAKFHLCRALHCWASPWR